MKEEKNPINTSSARIKDFGERYANGPFAKIANPEPMSSAVEFTPTTDKEDEENPNSLPGNKRNAVAKQLYEDSRGHIETREPSHEESRKINTDSAKDALSQDMGGMKIHVLQEDAPAPDHTDTLTTEEERVFKDVLDRGFLDKPKNTPTEINPIDAEIQEMRKKIEKVAKLIDEKVQNKEYSELLGDKLGEAVKDHAVRLHETMQRKGSVPEEETKKELATLLEESASLGSGEWEKRFTASDTPTVPPAQTENAEPGVSEVISETKIEQEQKPISEEEAAVQFENLPEERRLGILKTVADAGFGFEKKKNELFSETFGFLAGDAKTNDRDKTMQRFFDSIKEVFERDAKRAEQNRADLRNGKEMKLTLFGKDLDIRTLRGIGFLWSNTLKIGRSILGPAQLWNLGFITTSIGLESAKEARFKNEDVIEKTRIQDIDEAAEKAWAVYKEAQKKADEGAPMTKEALQKAYQESIPKDLLERLSKNIAPGMENKLLQGLLKKDLKRSVEKMSRELEKINTDKNLSEEAKNLQKEAYLNNWFNRSQRLKDFDRMVSQNGEIDELAAIVRYGELAAKTAVYVMMADSMRRVGMKIADLFSSSDGVETVVGGIPVTSEHIGGHDPVETAAVGAISQSMHAVQTPAASERLVDELLGKINEPKIMPELPEKTFSVGADEVDIVPHADGAGMVIPEAVKIPQETIPEPKWSVSETPAEHNGTIIPEAVKIPRETIPEPKWLSATETLPPRQMTIENTLQELGKAYTVKEGDNVWNIIRGKLLGNDEFAKLEPRQQNFIIDSLKDKITELAKTSPDKLRELGIRKDPNLIYPGDKLNFGKVFNESDELKKLFSRTESLPSAPQAAAPVPVYAPNGVPEAVGAATSAPIAPQAPEHIIAPIGYTQVHIPVNPPQNMPPSIQPPPFDMPYPPQGPMVRGMMAPQSETAADIANRMIEEDKGIARYMTEADKYAAQAMSQNNRDISEWITESDKNISQPDAISWFNAHVPRIENPYMAPLHELPPIYPHYIQQGISRQYPHMSSDMQSRFFGGRMVNLMAQNGYEPTVNAVNNMGRVFGIEKPIQVNYQNSTETPAELLARMLCQRSQELGHLPPRLPETPALIDAVNRFGAPNQVSQGVIA